MTSTSAAPSLMFSKNQTDWTLYNDNEDNAFLQFKANELKNDRAKNTETPFDLAKAQVENYRRTEHPFIRVSPAIKSIVRALGDFVSTVLPEYSDTNFEEGHPLPSCSKQSESSATATVRPIRSFPFKHFFIFPFSF